MDAHLRAGVAVYNEGEYHGAHDAWEELWLDLAAGTDDERFLHGLIQFTAAVFHARYGNWAGAVGLADSGREYLRDLPGDYRRVNVDAARSYLAALEADPERIERARPPALRVDGDALLYDDLSFDAAVIAAGVLAAEHGYDESRREEAASFALANLGDDGAPGFETLVVEFLRGSAEH
ncbi:DUF309 domain-containing protein [Halolamina rubra]|uniref:DUF309 domain-containing protein n=1 Tax=Halolamina rubra TaxID=1380430 RepID=UPI00067904C9|nr:DUF309 domain-containing protein [Halolamina rubra]